MMKPPLFLADLEAKPAALERLAATLDKRDPFDALPTDPRRVVLLGMGSSHYAADGAALRLRAAGIDAVAEYASAAAGHPPAPDTLVVAISASGESTETLEAVGRYAGRSPIVALTNAPGSRLAAAADVVVDLVAGTETSGIASRTFQHTGLLLRGLERRLNGRPFDVAALSRRVADATRDLLERRSDWLPPVLTALDGPDGVFVLAPAERLASAQQAALVIREAARRLSVACETGDWSHVDVYLTKTLDYRAFVFAGSRWDGQALDWLAKRESTVVAVGREVPDAAAVVRYAGDDEPEVAAHAEVLVGELIAAAWAMPE
jgi:glucosamine--fructose-6-phosphate aminotransferase (isomerizing)